jgi:hypothetical protein
VQQFFSDGAIALHTRSLKYGKLEQVYSSSSATTVSRSIATRFYMPFGAESAQGQFVAVPPALIKRGKTAFNVLPCGVEVRFFFLSSSPLAVVFLIGSLLLTLSR